MKHRGLTLVEALIGVFIIALVFTTVGNIFVASNEFTRDEQNRILVGEQAVRLFSTVDETLRQAKAVLASTAIGSGYTTDEDTLVFTLPALLNDETLSATDVDTGVLTLDTNQAGNTKLRILLEPHGTSQRQALDQTVVERVKDVYFRYNNVTPSLANAVTVTVTVEKSTSKKTYQQTNILYATFRNRS